MNRDSRSEDGRTMNYGKTKVRAPCDTGIPTGFQQVSTDRDGLEAETSTGQLLFDSGAYYRDQSTGSTVLETASVRFPIGDPEKHYDVSLLLSPGGCTTHRGS